MGFDGLWIDNNSWLYKYVINSGEIARPGDLKSWNRLDRSNFPSSLDELIDAVDSQTKVVVVDIETVADPTSSMYLAVLRQLFKNIGEKRVLPIVALVQPSHYSSLLKSAINLDYVSLLKYPADTKGKEACLTTCDEQGGEALTPVADISKYIFGTELLEHINKERRRLGGAPAQTCSAQPDDDKMDPTPTFTVDPETLRMLRTTQSLDINPAEPRPGGRDNSLTVMFSPQDLEEMRKGLPTVSQRKTHPVPTFYVHEEAGQMPVISPVNGSADNPAGRRDRRGDKNVPRAGPIDGPPTTSEIAVTEHVAPMTYEKGLVIGIGDLHGHSPAQTKLFDGLQKQYGIFKDREELILEEDVDMIHTGDYIDRGNSGLVVIGNVMKLQERNPNNVTALLGNHELLALAGLRRAKSALDTGDLSMGYYCIHGMNGGLEFIREFGQTEQEAFQNYVQRMSREGDIGKWIRSLKPLMHRIIYDKKVLFVHGGIPANLRDEYAVEDYLERFKEHVRTDSEQMGGNTIKYSGHELTDQDSVFWDRSIALNKSMSREEADDIVGNLGVDYIVIGHSVNAGEIANIGGRIFDIDIGMCPAYGENDPTAIVFKRHGIFSFSVKKGEQQLVKF